MDNLLPHAGTRVAIVLSQQFQVENVDDSVVVQICRGGRCRVVVDANRESIELINHIVTINITCQQTNGGFCCGIPSNDCYGSLGAEEAAGSGFHSIGPGRSLELE